jgi:hypothetical protein
MERILGCEVDLSAVEDRLAANFCEVFEYPVPVPIPASFKIDQTAQIAERVGQI